VFPSISLLRKKPVTKAAFSLFAVLCLTALLLVGCNLNGDDYVSLEGYWKSSIGDGFEISGETFTQYDNADKDVSFAGTIVNDPDLSAPTGSLTIKITDGGTWYKTEDCYYVIKWKSLSEKGVQQSSAALYIGENDPGNDFASGKPTQVEAESTYIETSDPSTNYFAFYGEYTKQ
jgi:hypothetical protein